MVLWTRKKCALRSLCFLFHNVYENKPVAILAQVFWFENPQTGRPAAGSP